MGCQSVSDSNASLMTRALETKIVRSQTNFGSALAVLPTTSATGPVWFAPDEGPGSLEEDEPAVLTAAICLTWNTAA